MTSFSPEYLKFREKLMQDNANSMSLGEKIETILRCRSNGLLGKYLGCSADTHGACLIDGKIYKVKRSIEVDGQGCIVYNVHDNTVAVRSTFQAIASIKESDFKPVC